MTSSREQFELASSSSSEGPKGFRDFRILWFGQAASLIGTGMMRFGLGVWVIEHTGQATPFTLTVLFAALPGILLAPLAGVVVDRFDRRQVMLVADGLAALITFAIALILLLSDLALWHIYLLVFASAVFSSFQEPAMTASIATLIPAERLGQASGMMSIIQAAEMLIAPVLAGAVYGFIGLAGIFMLDLITFIIAVITQLLVRIPSPERSIIGREAAKSIAQDLRSGFTFIFQRPALARMLLYFSLVNFMASLAVVLVPPMVLAVANEQTLGMVQSVQGFGMLLGSIMMSNWNGFRPRMRGVILFIGLYGLSFMMTSLHSAPVLIATGLFIMAFNMPLGAGHAQPIWQMIIPQDMHGRVFSVRNVFSRALMPLAYLLAGPLMDGVFEPWMTTGDHLLNNLLGNGDGRGAAAIFLISGIMIMVLTILAASNPLLRKIETSLPKTS